MERLPQLLLELGSDGRSAEPVFGSLAKEEMGDNGNMKWDHVPDKSAEGLKVVIVEPWVTGIGLDNVGDGDQMAENVI